MPRFFASFLQHSQVAQQEARSAEIDALLLARFGAGHTAAAAVSFPLQKGVYLVCGKKVVVK
mgnify:CR=1 FL=1